MAALGASSCNSPSCLAAKSVVVKTTPVTLPPGRLRLATKPVLTGSKPVVKTIGIVAVAALTAGRRLQAGHASPRGWRGASAPMQICSNNYKNTRCARASVAGRWGGLPLLAFTGALMTSLLVATALTPVRAGDMTHERALNVSKEPQNWLLHHGNFQGHRFSQLKEINTDTVKNLKPVFSVALGGFESGGRYKFGNLEATPIVEDGILYVPDGWGSVYAIDVSNSKKGVIKWKFDPGVDRPWAGDVACCGVNNRGVALWKDKVISIALDGRMFSLNKATGEMVWERKIADPAIAETLTIAPLVVRDLARLRLMPWRLARAWSDSPPRYS